MINYAKKAAQGATSVLLFSILASLIAYLTRIILARNLQPEKYGLFYAVFTFVIFFLFFRDLGLDQALVKYIAEYKVLERFNTIKTLIISTFTFQFLSSIIFAFFFLILSDYLEVNYFKDPQAGLILNLLIIYVFLSVLFTVVKQTLQGFQLIPLFASMEFFKNIIILISLFIFLKLGYSLLSPVFAYILVSPILFLLYFPVVLKKFDFLRYKITNFGETSKKLFAFGVPVFATEVGGKIIGYIDTLILTYYVSLADVGIYNIVLPSALIFIFFSKAISAVLFPLSSELWTRNNKITLAKGLQLLHKYLFIVIAPVLITIGFFAKFLITFFFGEAYASGYFALQVLLIGIIFYVVASVNNNIIAGIGKPKTVTVIILSSAALNIILNFIIIPFYGYNGAALTTTLSYLLMLLFSTFKVTKYLKTNFPWKQWLKLIFPAFSFLAMMFLVEKTFYINTWLEIIISTIISFIVYLLVLSALKAIDFKEIKYYYKMVIK